MHTEDFVREVRRARPGLPPLSLLQLVTYQEELFPDTGEQGNRHTEFLFFFPVRKVRSTPKQTSDIHQS